MTTAALFIKANKWKEFKCPVTDEWLRKVWYAHTTDRCSATGGTEVRIRATTGVDLESVLLSKRGESGRPHIVGFFT